MSAGPNPPDPMRLHLKAPLSGVLMPLEQVPDPVFAQKLAGEGVSIDPLDQVLVAPCDGRILQVHGAGHAVTLAGPEGIEILIHVGLDTIQLRGEGFQPRVAAGDTVAAGDPLIEFDADLIAIRAKSLLTQIVIPVQERIVLVFPRCGTVKAGRDVILELSLHAPQKEVGADRTITLSSEAILVPNPTGLHARPAAVLANLARRFRSDIRLQREEDRADAKSVVAIMGLDVKYGEKVHLLAAGPDAAAALEALFPVLRQGLGDEGHRPAPAPASISRPSAAAPVPRPRSADPHLLLGVSASPGLAEGQVFQKRRPEIPLAEKGEDPYLERRRLDEALDQARSQLDALQARLQGESDSSRAAIFAAHQELLEDPALREMTVSAINKGKSAAFAWHRACKTYAAQLASLDNELLALRANDLQDLSERVIHILTGRTPPETELPPRTILIAETLTPSETAGLDRSRVAGFCTTGGGATSHSAILARAMDLPAVAGVDPRALRLPDGTAVILDGDQGTLRVDPSPEEASRIRNFLEKKAARKKMDREQARQPARTTDGRRLEVAANIGSLEEVRRSLTLGGEGVGLLRSEFLFLGRASAPSEAEQAAAYQAMAEILGRERRLIIRTLDVGGDKPLPYLSLPKEDNPQLGERGLRIGLERPEILRTQLRAILRAAGAAGRIQVMFPMVATLAEWRAARAVLEEERRNLGLPVIPAGIMVEIPSAALLADRFAAEVDFFSIGTNDLTQYTLAMDRGHAKLASQVDGLHPAVLHLIALTVQAARRQGKWVGLCGGLAGDPQAIPILIGLGVDELSVSVPAIPAVKSGIRSLSARECEKLARQALALDTASAVRQLVPTHEAKFP